MTTKICSVFIAANPAATNQLKLDEEIRAITAKIRASDMRDKLELIPVWAARPDDLLQTLNQHTPQIVHFSGHGNLSGEIILVDDFGNPKPVSGQALKALFTILKRNIRVVILNACYSIQQIEIITSVIDCAIGMNNAIGDHGAIVFTASFYRAIGFGCSVHDAFEQGKTALLLEAIPEENIPELHTKPGISASDIYLSDVSHDRTTNRSAGHPVSPPKILFKINDDIGMGIRLGGIHRGESLRLVSSEWSKYFDRGVVQSGWLYIPDAVGASVAVAFYKIHLYDDGTGYIHILDSANPTHKIYFETAIGFAIEQEFAWDNKSPVERTVIWRFRWK